MFENGEMVVFAIMIATTAFIFISFWRNRNGTRDAEKRGPPSAPLLNLIGAIIRGGVSTLPHHFMKAAEKLGPVISCKFGGK